MLLSVLFCMVLLASGQSYVLPVEKCHLEDSKCMVSAFQKFLPIFYEGIPELGVVKLDNIDVDINLGELMFNLKNGQFKGIENSIIDSVDWDVKKQRFEVVFHVDCSLNAQYTADGKIIILPIKGNGDFELKLKNMNVKLIFDYDIEKRKDGKNHIKLKKYSFEFDVKDGAEYNLSNLFNGNKELSDNAIKFINENWKEITNEFGGPVVKVLIEKLNYCMSQFFKKLALEDIAIL